MPSIVPSPPSSTSAPTVVLSWWLKDPLNPAANIPIRIPRTTAQAIQQEQMTVHHPLGRQYALVVADSTIGGEDGRLTIRTINDTEFAGLMALLTLQRTLLVTSPLGSNKYIRRASPPTTIWVDGANDTNHVRDTQFDYVEQPAP